MNFFKTLYLLVGFLLILAECGHNSPLKPSKQIPKQKVQPFKNNNNYNNNRPSTTAPPQKLRRGDQAGRSIQGQPKKTGTKDLKPPASSSVQNAKGRKISKVREYSGINKVEFQVCELNVKRCYGETFFYHFF